jgi:transglutaminase-like putative cysteine protease
MLGRFRHFTKGFLNFTANQRMDIHLQPTAFINSDHSGIIAFAKNAIGSETDQTKKAMLLYVAVRDGFRYDPFRIDLRKHALQASDLLTRDFGYCVEKANFLAAVGRAAGIPTRLGFAKVKNHIGTSKLESFLRTDELVFHGYTEFLLNEKWVKATPAFNKELCKKFNVAPLEFNGVDDSIFQEFNAEGDRYMEYLHDYGQFSDLPFDLYLSELKKHYPHIFKQKVVKGEGYYFIHD